MEHARILKEAVQYTDNSDGIMNQTWIPNWRREGRKKVDCGMKGKKRQETAVKVVKTLIIRNVV